MKLRGWTIGSLVAVVTAVVFAVLPATAGAHRAFCVETVNPHGKNVPPAGSTTMPGPRGGQNEDGFYRLSIESVAGSTIMISSTGLDPRVAGNVFNTMLAGPVNVKYTQAPGATTLTVKKIGSTNGQAGAVMWHITGPGDLVVWPSADPAAAVTCFVPPPPK